MSKVILAFLCITLIACAPEKRVVDIGATPPPEPDITKISTIPHGCQALVFNGQLSTGSHEFGLGQMLFAVAFDCGTREGRKCYYYHHVDSTTGQDLKDIRCE